MATVNCCISRQPPSPDGLAPRPAIRSPRKLQSPKKDYYSSSSSVAVDASVSKEISELQVVVEDDKSSNSSELGHITNKKSTGTINAVKEIVRKRLSRGSSFDESNKAAKRASRSSQGVGRSEEEIERRAELKRYNKERIREDLSKDTLYDDDAKSISSINDEASAFMRSAIWVGEYLPPPHLTPPDLTFPGVLSKPYSDSAIATPALLVRRDIIDDPAQFEVSRLPQSASFHKPQYSAVEDFANTKGKESGGVKIPPSTRSRRHSFPEITRDASVAEVKQMQSLSGGSTFSQSRDSPVSQEMQLPDIIDVESKSKWRLSFAASNKGEQLRKLSQEFRPADVGEMATMPRAVNDGVPISVPVGPRPLNRWLHSQGLRSASQALSDSEGSNNIDCLSSIYSGNEDFGGVDGSPEILSTLHLNEMFISQRLASSGVASNESLSNVGSRSKRMALNSSSGSRYTHVTHVQSLNASIPLSERIPDSWGKVRQDTSSSLYQSSSCPRTSPLISKLDLLATLKSKEDLVATNDVKRSIVLPGNEELHTEYNSVSLSSLRQSRATVESSTVSETDSHRKLEVELNVVKTRFAEVASRTKSPAPLSSKFHEDFDDIEIPPGLSSPNHRRRSTFARLGKIGFRTFDGQMEKMLGVPLPPSSPPKGLKNRKKSRDLLDVDADNEVMGAWGKAVQDAQKDNIGKRRKSVFPQDWRRKSNVKGSQKVKSSDEVDDDNNEAEYRLLMAKRDCVIDDWEQEMAMTAQKAKDKSKKVVPKVVLGQDHRYPASWSKYSSHDREDRTELMTSVLFLDNTTRQDFAIQSTKDGKTIWYRNEKTHHIHHHDNDECPPDPEKGFFKKLEDKVLMKLPLALTPAIKDTEFVVDQTFGRRGSIILSGKLEFPELEILPIELMTSDEIEEHVKDIIAQEKEEKKKHELPSKEEKFDTVLSGAREVKPANAITKAREAAGHIVALQNPEEGLLDDEMEMVSLPSEKAPAKKKKRLDQFGFEIVEDGPYCVPSEAPTHAKKKRHGHGTVEGKSPKSFISTKSRGSNAVAASSSETQESAWLAVDEKSFVNEPRTKIDEAQNKAGDKTFGTANLTTAETEDALMLKRPTSVMGGDGSNAGDKLLGDENMLTPKSDFSIADPRFYEDCLMVNVLATPPNMSEDGERMDGRDRVVSGSGSSDIGLQHVRTGEVFERKGVLGLAATLLEDEKELELKSIDSTPQSEVESGSEVDEAKVLNEVGAILDEEQLLEEKVSEGHQGDSAVREASLEAHVSATSEELSEKEKMLSVAESLVLSS